MICIRPGSGTSFLFDAELLARGVTVQERERFVDVAQGERTVLVVPPSKSQPGERFRMEVRYADGADPEGVTLELLVHPASAAGLVTVVRPVRSVKASPRELEQKDGRLQDCETALERVRQEEVPGPILTRLIAAGAMASPVEGVWVRDISKESRPSAGNALSVGKVISYRFIPSSQEDASPTVSVAVAMQLSNRGLEPWTPGSAALTVKDQAPRALKLWPRVPLAPGASLWLVMETELPRHEARGTFRLELGDESGLSPVVLGHVTFP